MPAASSHVRFLWMAVLLSSALACRAATRLVVPDTPTPLPTASPTASVTLSPTPLPTMTPLVAFESACPALVEGVLNTVNASVNLTGKGSDQTIGDERGISLVTYEIRDGQLTAPRIEPVPDELEAERNDRAAHEALWHYFGAIIPPAERALVSEFSLFTDGAGNHLGAVSLADADPAFWQLQLDVLDAESYYDLTYTLLHEQGHLLTLNTGQVMPSAAVLRFPDNTTIREQEEDACPNYFTGQGCSQADSYINQFFLRFWIYIYDEWAQIELERDRDTHDTLLEEFYNVYRDQFLSDYASTSPVEDVAESWAFFVLSPRPALDSIAHEKILFFYEYPELVERRTQILQQLCTAFPQ